MMMIIIDTHPHWQNQKPKWDTCHPRISRWIDNRPLFSFTNIYPRTASMLCSGAEQSSCPPDSQIRVVLLGRCLDWRIYWCGSGHRNRYSRSCSLFACDRCCDLWNEICCRSTKSPRRGRGYTEMCRSWTPFSHFSALFSICDAFLLLILQLSFCWIYIYIYKQINKYLLLLFIYFLFIFNFLFF